MTVFISIVTLFVAVFGAVVVLNKNVDVKGLRLAEKPMPSKSKQTAKFKANISLTMKTIIRWEQLTGRSFLELDYSDNEDIILLLYCSAISCNPGMIYTLEEFRHTTINEKLMRQLSQSLSREAIVVAQFRTDKPIETDSDSKEIAQGKITDIVSTLIVSGLNASYVMDEMQLCDLPMLVEAYERKKKEMLENNRLWTYLGILPHIDGKKLPSPADLYPFPWEAEEMGEKAAQAIQADAERFDTFMNEGQNLIKKQYGG